jgi:hypothetical protein
MESSMKRFVAILFLFWAVWPTGASAQSGDVSRAQTSAAGPEDLDEANPFAKLVKKYPFRNSSLSFWQNMNLLGITSKGAEQTWNPTYSWLWRLQPRYYLNDKFFVRLKVDLEIEWTNSDETTYYHEPLWGDIWLDAVSPKLYKDKLTGIDVSPSFRFVLPASKASQARSLYVGLSPGVGLHRSFKLPHKMAIDLSYAFMYQKNLNHYSTVQFDSPTISSCAGAFGGDCGMFLHSGARNPSHAFMNIFLVDWEITKKLRASQMIALFNYLLYDTTPGTVELAGGPTVTVGTDPAYDINMRAAIWWLTEVDYDVHRWVTLGLGLSTFNPQLTDDSHYRYPFFNRFTELMISATFNLDQIVASVDHRMRSRAFTSNVAPAQ